MGCVWFIYGKMELRYWLVSDRILGIFEYLGQVDCQNIVSSLIFNLAKRNKCLSGRQRLFEIFVSFVAVACL